jgi:hypothetical protein
MAAAKEMMVRPVTVRKISRKVGDSGYTRGPRALGSDGVPGVFLAMCPFRLFFFERNLVAVYCYLPMPEWMQDRLRDHDACHFGKGQHAAKDCQKPDENQDVGRVHSDKLRKTD